MKINLNLRPRIPFKSKLIYILLGVLVYFLFNSNVFAESYYDNLRESYTNYIINQFINEDGTSDVVEYMEETKPITEYTFRNLLDNLETGFNYYIQYNKYSNLNTDNPRISYRLILFSEQPKVIEVGSFDNYSGTTYETGLFFKPVVESRILKCYAFDFLEDNSTSYGRVNVAYSDTCFDLANTGINSRLGHSRAYLPHYAYHYTDNVKDYKLSDYVIHVLNFSLYNETTQETTLPSDINPNIIVPEETLQVEHLTLLQRIWKGISSIPTTIINSLSSLVDDITGWLHDFFIPDSEMFGDFVQTEYNFLQTKLGFMFYPITLITDFATRVYSLNDNTSAIFTIPNVDFMGTRLINTTSINLMDIVNENQAFSYLYQIYRVVVSALIVFWLTNLAYRKFNETFGGGYK